MKLTKKTLILFCQAVLGLVALLLLFAPAITRKNTDVTYSGFQVMFGCQTEVFGSKVQVLDPTFAGILTFFMIVATIVLPLCIAFLKNKKVTFILSIVLIAICAIGALFLFLGTTDLMLNPATSGVSASDFNANLGVGFIIDAILLLVIGASAVLTPIFIKD